MSKLSGEVYPIFTEMVSRQDWERRLGQTGHVIWLFGLSGSGKSTLALALEKAFFQEGYQIFLLDGDNLRSGLNKDLDFSQEQRRENIRRVAEVAKLLVKRGLLVIVSLITPLQSFRNLARSIINSEDFSDVYVKASFQVCKDRDPKKLYKKAEVGKIKQFTGKDSFFEDPGNQSSLILDTNSQCIEENLKSLRNYTLKKILPNG